MKVLLLSDIPPCENLTAGLVLSAMVRFIPRDSICCFIVANPLLDIRMSAEFSNIPISLHAKPNENWSWLPQRKSLKWISESICWAGELFTEKLLVRLLVSKAIKYGREQKVDRVWAVLQGQTTIRMAKAVADGLGVELHSHVWDPFSWWAKANCLDKQTTKHITRLFDNTIRHSVSVATASQPMADLYRTEFNAKALPVIASHRQEMAQTPNIGLDSQNTLLIGMAGQFYAAAEWNQLIKAMDAAKWVIAGCAVIIIVMGPQKPPGSSKPNVRFVGWKSQENAALLLSFCDLLYCPYPFDLKMKEVSQYSFPSKLVLYLAAGRPIIFHGPDYSSPAKYIKERDCGMVASQLLPTSVFNEIERIVSDKELYEKKLLNAGTAFKLDFTLKSMQNAFNDFIGIKLSSESKKYVKIYNHSGEHDDKNKAEYGLSLAGKYHSLLMCGYSLNTQLKIFKNVAKNTLRGFALRIPIIYRIYHEIHRLYDENKALKRSIEQLELKNESLKNLSVNKESKCKAIIDLNDKNLKKKLDAIQQNIINECNSEKSLLIDLAIQCELFHPSSDDNENYDSYDYGEPNVFSILYLPELNRPSKTETQQKQRNHFDKHKFFESVIRIICKKRIKRVFVSSDSYDYLDSTLFLSNLVSIPITIITSESMKFEIDSSKLENKEISYLNLK